ncbi:ABC transporter ATP-binding protein/permease [Brachybacterium huguangmaarense]|uniref:ABC transporter ATP-binding protein/permease n=1 Tax=Brachybacterium huguangmaarense TaxID=1652028 RepID=A0ABY6G5B0_9MICO|nr:ABC transporter ATP-binding protein [Brachybacterium huguangmaarense]UYG17836.1 ABC transporter ATP-binding protein/permease [Brachybacterium huguangmaarense]
MSSLLHIVRFTRSLSPLYAAIIICSVVTSAAGLAVPFIIGRATDAVTDAVSGRITVGAATTTVVVLAVALLAAELVSTVVSNLGGRYGDIMANRMRTILSVRYFEKLLNLPQRWFDVELTGTIVSRLNRSITEVTNFAKTFSNSFASMLITTLAVLVISAWYAWPLAALLLVIFPIYIWLTALTSRKWQRLEGEKNTEVDLAGGRFAEVIGQIRVVKSFVRERSELAQFARRFRATDALTAEQSTHWHVMDILRRGALNLIFFGIYLIIFIRTVRGDFTLGDMVLLIQLMSMARQPVQNMSWVIDSAQHAIAGSRDYFRVMETPVDARRTVSVDTATGDVVEREAATGEIIDNDVPADADAARRALDPVPGARAIDFRDVTFAYEKGEDVLHGISFDVAPGEKVAFVGESGGGKSTIVNLLLGLFPTAQGTISVAGHEIADLPLEQLRRSIGVVFQDASLFSGTIEENIAYGRPGATPEQIRAAARRANASTFIERFPAGYGTIIGERGLRLSGGQRQRIAVARAILKDAPILVLDEATSALDTKAERNVQAGLDELMAGRTSLIIAHRLSTIAGVDRIVTLEDGRIDEIGTPAELAASGGIYAQLLALQDSGSKKALAKFDITG